MSPYSASVTSDRRRSSWAPRADPVLIAAVLDAAVRLDDTEPPEAGKRSDLVQLVARRAQGLPLSKLFLLVRAEEDAVGDHCLS